MKMPYAALVSVFALLAPVVASTAQTTSPYAGQEHRSIKALSETEMRDLTQGRGMGLAKAAELNSYPGPLHVLEMAAQLGLSDLQRTTTEALVRGMREQATTVGAKIIEAEHHLDRAFAEGWIDPTYLRQQVSIIAMFQGELRVIHLETHLAQRAILTPEQIARYNEFRGYQSAGMPTPHHQHDH
jgi:Spy/CpxP family protein refolding chaperone